MHNKTVLARVLLVLRLWTRLRYTRISYICSITIICIKICKLHVRVFSTVLVQVYTVQAQNSLCKVLCGASDWRRASVPRDFGYLGTSATSGLRLGAEVLRHSLGRSYVTRGLCC